MVVVVVMRQLVYDARNQIRAIKKYGGGDNGTRAKIERKAGRQARPKAVK